MTMSHAHELEHEEDDVQIGSDDIVEVVEDDGPGGEPMEDDDDEFGGYDGEIVIGGPGPDDDMEGMEEMEGMEGMEQTEDNSLAASSVHAADKSIFALHLHPAFPNPPLAVSGGEDDLAYIFAPLPEQSGVAINSDNFTPVKLDGHSDSVVAAEFSHDGEMVATGGMDGKVRIWKRTSEGDDYTQWAPVAELDAGSEVIWLHWHPKGPVLGAGCEDSSVWLWQLPSGNVMTVLSGHTMPVTTGVFPPPNGRQILTASLDSTLILWNPSASVPMFKLSAFASTKALELDPATHGITSLAVSPDGALAAVGSAGGKVRLISLPKGDVLKTMEGHGEGHTEGESIEALAFVDLFGGQGGGKGVVLISGGTDGRGYVWDVHSGRVRATINHDEPITFLAPHPAPNIHLVTSASADRVLKTWDIRTGNLVAEHKGHAGVVNNVCIAPAPAGEESTTGQAAAQLVISAGDDGVSLVWRV